jgi:hypothetical protein
MSKGSPRPACRFPPQRSLGVFCHPAAACRAIAEAHEVSVYEAPISEPWDMITFKNFWPTEGLEKFRFKRLKLLLGKSKRAQAVATVGQVEEQSSRPKL